jgi:squalene synthase HpnC
MDRHWPVAEAQAYTKWLATSHYENFQVVSFLLPRDLHQDFFNIYAFCRWSDDLGDEIGSPEESLRLLHWWSRLLDQAFDGRASHPVLVALRTTIDRHALPKQPFSDLIRAFVQDQTVGRYANWQELYEYCRFSANPVGRLILMLAGYRDQERFRLSDATCTALQLANHWQDVSIDLRKNRIYIPQDVMARHGCTEADLVAGRESDAFVATMREIVDRAQELFETGLPLCSMVNRRLSLDLHLFSRGGMRVLDKIRAQGYRVLHQRPYIGKWERAGILLSSLARTAFLRAAA